MPMRSASRLILPAMLVTGTMLASFAASCGGNGEGNSNSSASTSGGHGGNAAGAGGAMATSSGTGVADGGVVSDYPCPGCPSFPPSGAPQCDPKALGPTKIAYPLDGLLLPPNMNVLEVQFIPPAGATLFQVDFSNAVTHVTVETKCNPVTPVRGGPSLGCGITLSQAAWNDIANINRDGDPLHVTVRATADGSCVSSSEDKIDILFAKEDIVGGIYYWQAAVYGGIGGKTGGIYSHDFGTFDPTPTPFYTSGATGTCVGCHFLSRDGARMSLASDDPDGDDEFGDVKTHVMDVAGRAVIGGSKMSPGFQTFTHDHTKMIASTFKTQKNASFAVFDGDGVMQLANDTLPMGVTATQPDLSRDDTLLAYVVPKSGSISMEGDHHFMGGSLYTSTFDPATNALGMPKLVIASAGTENYYYPAISANSDFLMFNDAPSDDSFYNRKARVKLLHLPAQAGATPIDLPALNVKDGLSNSWPRWSPFVQTYKGHKILWATFSSNRDYGLHLSNAGFDNCYPPESPSYDQPQPLSKQGVGYENCAQPQIWMAAIIVDPDTSLDAGDRSFPAFWLPFQDVTSHNHCAQWVEKIQSGGNPPDGGTCGDVGASCNASSLCCADTVCCGGICQYTCVK